METGSLNENIINMRTSTYLTNTIIAVVLSMISLPVIAQDTQVEPCSKTGPDERKTMQEYSLFNEFYKQDNIKDSYKHWLYVYNNAPGFRETTHTRGVSMFQDKLDALKKAEKGDTPLYKTTLDTLREIYNKRIDCFGDDDGAIAGRLGYDLYKYQPKEIKDNLKMLKQSVEKGGKFTDYFVIQSYIITIEKAVKKEMITEEELLEEYFRVSDVMTANMEGVRYEAGAKVEYKATSSTDGFVVTYMNSKGKKEQKIVEGKEWTISLVGKKDEGVYISAKASGNASPIKVSVFYAGKLIDKASSSGDQAVATASGVVVTEKRAGKYESVKEFIDNRMLAFVSCDVVIPRLKEEYKTKQNDQDFWRKGFAQLSQLRCFDEPLTIELAEKLASIDPNEDIYRVIGRYYQKNKDYTKAIDAYQKVLEFADDDNERGEYLMDIAAMYRTKGDYPSARKYAQQAAAKKGGWGEPYLLIGDLYRGSGKKCGSGTGWDSQIVTWAAVDMYEKAKAVDGSASSKANKKIADTKKYMPTQGDCFFRNLKEGDSYPVGCWIGVTTTVRYGPDPE